LNLNADQEKYSNSSSMGQAEQRVFGNENLTKKVSVQFSTADSLEGKLTEIFQATVCPMATTEVSENSPVKDCQGQKIKGKSGVNGESNVGVQNAQSLAESSAGNFIRATLVGQEVKYSFQCKIGHRFQ
jgi:hypothetical protein